MTDKDREEANGVYAAHLGGGIDYAAIELARIRREAREEAERKLGIAVDALTYVQSLKSSIGENWGELVYVDFAFIGDALKEVQDV